MEKWREVCEGTDDESSILTGRTGCPCSRAAFKAGGDEVGSGKFENPDSSAALAVNTFGWFVGRPELLPAFPSLASIFPATFVDVEYCARFPWAGGRHPWLDAVIETDQHLIGVEFNVLSHFGTRSGFRYQRRTTVTCGAAGWVRLRECEMDYGPEVNAFSIWTQRSW